MTPEQHIRQLMKRAEAAARKSDTLAEQAAMAAHRAYEILRFGKTELSPEGRAVMERLDKAHDKAGDARHALGDVVYQLEQAQKAGGARRDRRRSSRKRSLLRV